MEVVILERKWDAVPPVAFTATGTPYGQITVADTAGFRVKMVVGITSNNLPPVPCQVKRVISNTVMVVGQIDQKVVGWGQIDMSPFGTGNAAMVSAEQQDKAQVPPDPHYLAVYEGDPVCADRIIQVDKYGNYIDDGNPLPVAFDGTVEIGNVSIVEGGNTMKVNPDGSINVIVESVPSPNSQVISIYSEVPNVVSGSTTQLVTYTVPAGYQAVFQKCQVSGENIARYDLLIGGIAVDTIRTNFGGDLTKEFNWETGNDSGYVLSAGQVISTQVLHNRPYLGTFEARLQLLLINLS